MRYMKFDGNELAKKQGLFRLAPAEVAAEAGVSIGTLRKAYRNEVPEETLNVIAQALETCRQKLLSKLQCKVIG